MRKPYNAVDVAVTACTSPIWVFYYLFVETDKKMQNIVTFFDLQSLTYYIMLSVWTTQMCTQSKAAPFIHDDSDSITLTIYLF